MSCSAPLAWADLVQYWAGDLEPDATDRVDEHLMGCATCSAQAARVAAVVSALRELILPALCRHADLYLAGHEHTLEAHTDDCRAVAGTEGRPPLGHVVSGAAGKQRPLNSAFARHQEENNPQMRSLFAAGLVWGFAHVTLAANSATVRLVTTPDDGSGEPVLAFEHRFPRRSGGQ